VPPEYNLISTSFCAYHKPRVYFIALSERAVHDLDAVLLAARVLLSPATVHRCFIDYDVFYTQMEVDAADAAQSADDDHIRAGTAFAIILLDPQKKPL
jgi:hypothetical protein